MIMKRYTSPMSPMLVSNSYVFKIMGPEGSSRKTFKIEIQATKKRTTYTQEGDSH
jgi:hypothetical protein